MEFFVDSETPAEELQQIRDAIEKLINTCGLSEVKYLESDVVYIENSIVIHGTFELLELIISPLLDREELVLSNEMDENLALNCSSAVIYPLYEEKQ